jgi:Mrp family chromosome partitioning ATPase
MDAIPMLARGVRRFWWLPLTAAVIGLVFGGAVLTTRPVRYSATSAILVLAVPDASGDDPTRPAPVNLATESQLVRSTDTAVRAAALMHTTTAPALLVNAVTVDPVTDTSVLELHFEADTAVQAQAGAHAFAQAYLDARAQSATSALSGQKAVVTSSLDASTAQLADLDTKIGKLASDSPQLPTLHSSRATLANQIAALTGRLNDLSTTVVNPGQLIRDADLPTQPLPRHGWLFVGGGLGLGLIAGLAAAGLWERLRARVHDGDDVAERAGVDVLAELADTEPRLHTPSDHTGRGYHRLRNEVVAALATGDRVLLVTSASNGPASTVVAANLAAALARVGYEVILVGANPTAIGHAPVLLSGMFDISDVPGLTDVLSGRTDLGTALQVPPREPRLRVITPGGSASASRLLQSSAMRAVVTGLRTRARFVVIDAPSAASGADAQSLAGLADAAIVVAEAGRSRHAEVADAAGQVGLGARVLGAVVLPRVEPPPSTEDGVVFLEVAPRPWKTIDEPLPPSPSAADAREPLPDRRV